MPHFVKGLRSGVLGQLGETPVVLHLRMQEVLVDGGELTGQLLVEQAQNIGITLHDHSYGLNGCQVWPRLAGWAEGCGCSSTLPCWFRMFQQGLAALSASKLG